MNLNEQLIKEKYKEFYGKNTEQMEILIKDKRVPLTVKQIIERRLNSKQEDWKNNYFDTCDAIVRFKNKFKIIKNCDILKQMNKNTELTNYGNSITKVGSKFQKADFGEWDKYDLEEYCIWVVNVMKELKRVIKSTGTIWLNCGDSFYTKSGSGQGSNYLKHHEEMDGGRGELHKAYTETRGKFKSNWLQNKQRLLIPYRIAIACQDELGLVLRNDITWVKQILNWKTKESQGTSMPTSVQDRLNTNSEAIFLFVKSNDYFFNLDAVRVKRKEVSIKRNEYGRADVGSKEGVSMGRALNPGEFLNPKGKNPGDCIIFPLEPSSENHYAMFPKTLPEFCIKAGCPDNGLVLDPFSGGGTTCYVAKHLLRNYIGIEINPQYIKEIQNAKLSQNVLDLDKFTLSTKGVKENDGNN